MSQHREQENLADVALVNEKTTVKYAWYMKAIIIIIALISIVPDLTNKGEHTALYKMQLVMSKNPKIVSS